MDLRITDCDLDRALAEEKRIEWLKQQEEDDYEVGQIKFVSVSKLR